jgi:osmotically-inducible protein OsmY
MARTFLDDGRIEFRPRARPTARPSAQRADERIREQLRARLARAGIDVDAVSVTVADGVVRLVGSVPAARTKQAIEDAAARCAGASNVDTRLRVRRAPPEPPA